MHAAHAGLAEEESMIEMARNATDPNGRDRFACSNEAWTLLQELGRAGGWQPRGTTYSVPERLRIELPAARHDYQPGGLLDHKQLDDEDAFAWAHALDGAKQSPQFASLLAQHASAMPHGESATQTVDSLIYEFTQFAYGGAFTFAVHMPGKGDEVR